MKVHLYGNTLNNSYNLTQFLRAKGIEAEMFLDDLSPSVQDYPWWEDRGINKENFPSWIHYYPTRPFFLLPNKKVRQMIDDFSKCDVALVCCYGPIVAMKAKIPFVFYAIGSDLNCINLHEELMLILKTKLPITRKIMRLVKILTYRPLQVKAIKKCANLILVLMGYQVNPYLKKNDLLFKTLKARLLWDIKKYSPKVDLVLNEKYKKYDIVFFMIARHNHSSIWNDLKGNDKFLRAFANFINCKDQPNVKLVLINKGDDVNLSKNIIEDYEFEEYVEWVEQMDKDGIRSYESLSNVVVVDQFWHNEWYKRYPEDNEKPVMGFGSGSIEAMSASRPLITVFFDEDFYNGETPPIFTAFTEEEILQRLNQCYEMTVLEREQMGKKGREFVLKYHHWENNIDMYIDALKKVVNVNLGSDIKK